MKRESPTSISGRGSSKRKGIVMIELVEVKTGRVIERYDYDFDEFIETEYGGFFSLITDDGFILGDIRPEFAWRRSKTTELVNIP